MADDNDPGQGPGRNDGFWRRLWRQPRRRYLLGIPAGGVAALVLGIILTGGFLKTVEATNTLAFCTSCHEMEAFVYQEYKQSPHYSNPSGVRVICADCHVPKEFFPKMVRKVQASFNELPNHFLGKISTKEKFEAHRAEMAERVWARMRANDSKACRNCHSYEAMALDAQSRSASRRHSPEYRERTGRTCIDCHEGIAHELPQEM